jgi:cytochrome c553
MRPAPAAALAAAAAAIVACAPPSRLAAQDPAAWQGFAPAQAPTWSAADLEFFLHGSMSTEVVPERVFAAFRAIYPDLLPGDGFAAFGFVADARSGQLPVGVSRREVKHLGSLPSLGLNCAACHTTELQDQGTVVRLLGSVGHLDSEAFFGAVTAAELRTADPANMAAFLRELLRVADPAHAAAALPHLDRQLAQQKDAIAAAIAADPSGGKDFAFGALQELHAADLAFDGACIEAGVDLAALARTYLRLFHNMRAMLHIPDQLPAKLPPTSGPGRNDAFGFLSAVLFRAPTEYAPVKFGLLWNTADRPWVDWDGNARSPLGRNILTSIALGAPLLGRRAQLDLALVQRHTALTEVIRPPAWPWPVDRAAAARGEPTYKQRCASCHEGPETDARLYDPKELGTDARRAKAFDSQHSGLFNGLFANLQLEGFEAPKEPTMRSTQRYLAAGMAGVWARSPYLHNGSVRTLAELLSPPASRAKSFRSGSRIYDREHCGFADDGTYVFDTAAPGNGNGGHDYGTDLADADRRDLLEYLKTR